MGRILAGRVGAVVTAGAVASDVHMVEIGRDPPASSMTVITGVATREMGGMLTCCGDAVMT